jgi:hypothetical protein
MYTFIYSHQTKTYALIHVTKYILHPIQRKPNVDEGLGEGAVEAIQWNRSFNGIN